MPNHIIIRDILLPSEQEKILEFVDSLKIEGNLTNPHLKALLKKLNGFSCMFDLSKNETSNKIAKYQSGGLDVRTDAPDILLGLANSICLTVGIPNKNCFLQIVDMAEGGMIGAHYDAAFSNLINYKCNVSVFSEPYEFVIEKEKIQVNEGDLYCFEASLYKHWTPNPFKSRRVLLSFGFMLEYEELGRSKSDPRIRLSERIQRHFQDK